MARRRSVRFPLDLACGFDPGITLTTWMLISHTIPPLHLITNNPVMLNIQKLETSRVM